MSDNSFEGTIFDFDRSEPEYYDVVENPIDLMKIHNKIKNEEYSDVDQMTEDIQLMVENGFKYYKVKSYLIYPLVWTNSLPYNQVTS